MKNLSTIEAVVKALIVESGPEAFVAALNNVCCHGEALLAYGCNLKGYDKNDYVLREWFAGIEELSVAANKFEKMKV